MEIEIFALCDFAQDANGKMNIIGVFDTVNVATLPVKLHTFYYAARIRFNSTEAGNHKLSITLSDSNTKQILSPFEANLNIEQSGQSVDTVFNLAIGVNNATIEKESKHNIKLLIDGSILKDLPLYIKRRQ